MQQQAKSCIHVDTDDKKSDCFSYISKRCNVYAENLGAIVQKLLCNPWIILSKRSINKREKQVNMSYSRLFFLCTSKQEIFHYHDYFRL